jgi:phosphatidylglycerol:prolipoprotein diacylglycerol transferase
MLDFIIWDVAPQIFTIPQFSIFGNSFGPLAPVWYGLLFATAFLIGQQIIIKIYKIEGKSEKQVETLTIYMILATVIGARLGHCIFYEPEEFFWEPAKLIKILYIWHGGLASHGAGIAILFAIWLYCRKYPTEKYFYILDRMAIIVALAGCFIRFGNLMNSEIIGIPTDASQGFVFVNSTTTYLKEDFKQIKEIEVKQNGKDTTFEGIYLRGIDIKMKIKSFGNGNLKEMAEDKICRVINGINVDSAQGFHSDRTHVLVLNTKDAATVGAEDRKGTTVTIRAWGVPRHPTQLYESLSSLLLFFVLIYVYSRNKANTPQGLLFGIFMVWIFTLRFCYEFIKENQVSFENGMPLNMGQILSIPMVVIGIVALVMSLKKKK